MKRIRAADLFCGAGGTSTGLIQACEGLGLRLDLTAINHWDIAVQTHAHNHPGARHLCKTLDQVDPRKLFARLDVLIASPECTHHSIARGGKPCSDQSRATAWEVIRWADALQPRHVLVENVRELASWGPLSDRGRPLKRRRGETFAAWLGALRSLGYAVEHRILNAADHGAATSRERLYVLAVRGKGPVLWPEPTHDRRSEPTFFGSRKPWRAAREVIDWTIRGESIFHRKRPLSENTLKRIAEGLRRFGGKAAEPFLLQLSHGGRLRSLGDPLPTVTCARRGEIGLVEPFILPPEGIHRGNVPRSLDSPIQTITSRGGGCLVEPFVLGQQSGSVARHLDRPLPTIATDGAISLVEPFVVPLRGTTDGMMPPRETGSPLPTITAGGNHLGLCEPFLVPYYGTGVPDRVSEPLATVPTRDRFGLVEPEALTLDILFRMLRPHELAAGQGFPAGYWFAGNKEQQVKQIGNSVEVNQARALCSAFLEGLAA